MVRKRILVPLLTAAALILGAALVFSIHECAIPSGTGVGDVDGSSTAGGPCTGSCSRDPAPAGFCLRASRRDMRVMYFSLGVLIGKACLVIFERFADGEVGQASDGAAEKGKN